MNKAYALIGGALALLTTLNATHAQTNRTICGERDQIVETLTGRLGETPQSWGMGPNNRIVEVFASEETGSWTITITAPNGTTCLVAAGQFWENLPPLPVGEPL
jgi:hypothetical protein